jgi:hypothetical protein
MLVMRNIQSKLECLLCVYVRVALAPVLLFRQVHVVARYRMPGHHARDCQACPRYLRQNRVLFALSSFSLSPSGLTYASVAIRNVRSSRR